MIVCFLKLIRYNAYVFYPCIYVNTFLCVARPPRIWRSDFHWHPILFLFLLSEMYWFFFPDVLYHPHVWLWTIWNLLPLFLSVLISFHKKTVPSNPQITNTKMQVTSTFRQSLCLLPIFIDRRASTAVSFHEHLRYLSSSWMYNSKLLPVVLPFTDDKRPFSVPFSSTVPNLFASHRIFIHSLSGNQNHQYTCPCIFYGFVKLLSTPSELAASNSIFSSCLLYIIPAEIF